MRGTNEFYRFRHVDFIDSRPKVLTTKGVAEWQRLRRLMSLSREEIDTQVYAQENKNKFWRHDVRCATAERNRVREQLSRLNHR